MTAQDIRAKREAMIADMNKQQTEALRNLRSGGYEQHKVELLLPLAVTLAKSIVWALFSIAEALRERL